MTIIITSSDKSDGHSTPLMLNGKLGYWLNQEDCEEVGYELIDVAAHSRLYVKMPRLGRLLVSTARLSKSLDNVRPDPLKWNDGNPPYVGWWNASIRKSKTTFRWFNGSDWGSACDEGDQSDLAAILASHKYNLGGIQWRWHYPENARVKRIDSRTGQVCRITHPGL